MYLTENDWRIINFNVAFLIFSIAFLIIGFVQGLSAARWGWGALMLAIVNISMVLFKSAVYPVGGAARALQQQKLAVTTPKKPPPITKTPGKSSQSKKMYQQQLQQQNQYGNDLSMSTSPSSLSPSKHSRLLYSRSSPMSSSSTPKDDSSLVDLLVAQNSLESTPSGPNDPRNNNSMLNVSLLANRFQNAIKPTQSPARKEIIEDGLVFKDFSLVMEEWNLSYKIDVWSERVREWLASHVFHSLVERIDKVDQFLKSLGWDHLSCANATFAESLNASPPKPYLNTTNTSSLFGIPVPTAAPSLFGNNQSNSLFGNRVMGGAGGLAGSNTTKRVPNSLIELQSLYPNESVVVERMALEKILSFDQNTRPYIVERIRTLSRGSGLAQYRWNSGGPLFNNQSLPTDALLVMTLFCRYMDERMPNDSYIPDPNHPFSSKYFIDTPKSKISSGIKIRQASRNPPHFQILIDQVVYDVANGRTNVFDTISLFVYQMKMNYNGKLGLISLGVKGLDLLQIL